MTRRVNTGVRGIAFGLVAAAAMTAASSCGEQDVAGACSFSFAAGGCGGSSAQDVDLCVLADTEAACRSYAENVRGTSCALPASMGVRFDAEGECPGSCQSDMECNVAEGECCLGAPSGQCSSAAACASVCPEGATLQGDPPLCTCEMGSVWNADFTACLMTELPGSGSGTGTGAGSGTGEDPDTGGDRDTGDPDTGGDRDTGDPDTGGDRDTGEDPDTGGNTDTGAASETG